MNIEKLIRRSKKDNAKAQKALYEKYVGLMYSVISRYVTVKPDAEDILLEAFMKIFQKIKDFEFINEKAFVGWMKRITINEALMFVRKDYGTIYKVDDNDNLENSELVSPDILEENELIELIEQLPKGYRMVFLLHVVDGYSHKEIGENLGIAEGTSRSQFFKARKLTSTKIR